MLTHEPSPIDKHCPQCGTTVGIITVERKESFTVHCALCQQTWTVLNTARLSVPKALLWAS